MQQIHGYMKNDTETGPCYVKNINGRNKGFETTNYKSNHDLVIGNPPYGSFKLYDKNNKEYNTKH